MKLTEEQKQMLINVLKKQYTDGKKWLEKDETKALYASTPEKMTEYLYANERIKDYYKRLEKGEVEPEFKTNDNNNDNWLWGIVALAALFGSFNGKKDGE